MLDFDAIRQILIRNADHLQDHCLYNNMVRYGKNYTIKLWLKDISCGLSIFEVILNRIKSYLKNIIIWTLLIGLMRYIKLSIRAVMHSQGGKSLVWISCVVQVGSSVFYSYLFS
uniref:Riboflavin transporter n=1 Tax=Glossina palpalis gambiensis TaxID=67801 RepID=A0A1B0BE79_9MUSC